MLTVEKSYKNNQEITKQFKEVNSEKLFFKIFIFLNSNKLQLQKDFMSDLGLDLQTAARNKKYNGLRNYKKMYKNNL